MSFAQVLAEEGALSATNAHILRAERALQLDEYLVAAIEYRKAAMLSDKIELTRKATHFCFIHKFNDEALIAAKRWIKLDKKSDEARVFLGQLYFRLDDLKNSRRQFRRLIRAGKKDPSKQFLLLVSYLTNEQYPKRADKLMRSLAKPYRDLAMAHFAVAVLALQAGDIEYTKERVIRSMELDPELGRPKLLYARALMAEGKKDKAISYLEHIIGDSAYPDPDARLELASFYMMFGRDEDALSQVNQVLMDYKGRDDALRLMGIINFRLDRLDAAWGNFQDLLASGQYQMDALFNLARISDYREQYERAVRLYGEVRFGENAIISQRRASVLLAHQLNDVESAMNLLEAFAETSPNFAIEAITLKAQLLVSLKRYEEGMGLYEKVIEFRPDNESLFLSLAEIMLRIGRIDESIIAYRNAVKRWPDSALALNALGYTLADHTNQFFESEELIRKALVLEPENPAIIDSLGWILYKTGRYEEALVELRRAYELLPDHEVASHIVEVLVELEQYDEALQVLESAEKSILESELLKNVRDRYFSEKP
ncbi:MAG: tetratricopeptide repeat protein [Woeseiaceae bacterium]|nr:tetratricopeptide repeat protein [Woeseiaceae bacterium]